MRTQSLLAMCLALPSIAVGQTGQLPANTMRAHFINVRQGDATLLEFACGTILIDAGGQAVSDRNVLVDYIQEVFDDNPDISEPINSIITTHNHQDHTKSLTRVFGEFGALNVVENGQRKREGRANRAEKPLQDIADSDPDVWTQIDDEEIQSPLVGLNIEEIDAVDDCPASSVDPVLTVLSADIAEDPGWGNERGKPHFDDENNHSIVIRLDFGEASFLFTGDLEDPAILTMIDFYDGTDWLDVDVYQAGHHGATNGTNQELTEALDGLDLAVISMGACNSPKRRGFNAWTHGHPRAGTVGLLQSAVRKDRQTSKVVNVADGQFRFHTETMRDAVYATGWDGNVVVEAHSNGTYEVFIENPPMPDCS